MYEKRVISQVLEDYPTIINSLGETNDLPEWGKKIDWCVRYESILSSDDREISEILKFFSCYLYNKGGFRIFISQGSDGTVNLQLIWSKYGEIDLKTPQEFLPLFNPHSSYYDTEQIYREKLFRMIAEHYLLEIVTPESDRILREAIFNAKIILDKGL